MDLVLSGHVHSYERISRVLDGCLNSCAPLYLNLGDGGNREGDTLFFAWPVTSMPCPSSAQLILNQSASLMPCPSSAQAILNQSASLMPCPSSAQAILNQSASLMPCPSSAKPDGVFGGLSARMPLLVLCPGLVGTYIPWRDPQPDWSVFRESSFGVGRLLIVNSTHAHYVWNRSACEVQPTIPDWRWHPSASQLLIWQLTSQLASQLAPHHTEACLMISANPNMASNQDSQ